MKLIDRLAENIEQTIVTIWIGGMLVMVAVMLWQIHHDAARPFL